MLRIYSHPGFEALLVDAIHTIYIYSIQYTTWGNIVYTL